MIKLDSKEFWYPFEEKNPTTYFCILYKNLNYIQLQTDVQKPDIVRLKIWYEVKIFFQDDRVPIAFVPVCSDRAWGSNPAPIEVNDKASIDFSGAGSEPKQHS